MPVGPECCFGALTSGDVELLEYSYPIIIHRYSLMTDSGGAGKFRGGSGTAWEVEPLDKDMTLHQLRRGPAHPGDGCRRRASRRQSTRKVGRVELKTRRQGRDHPQEYHGDDQAGRDGHQHEPGRRRLWQSVRAADREGRVGREERPGFDRRRQARTMASSSPIPRHSRSIMPRASRTPAVGGLT